jgi:hypothetical protein
MCLHVVARRTSLFFRSAGFSFDTSTSQAQTSFMPVNSTHPAYDANVESWERVRDVLAGEAALKRGGEKYVVRLNAHSDKDFTDYIQRTFFYNATARTVSGYIGMIFRREPVLRIPEKSAPLHPVFDAFIHDVDMLGTTLDEYAKTIIHDVVAVGRAGTLIDWHSDGVNRAYLSMYAAESILNWRQIRINGHMKLSLVVLAESAPGQPKDDDPFVAEDVAQIRVLKLVPSKSRRKLTYTYHVEIWQHLPVSRDSKDKKWKLLDTLTPLRLGKPLSAIPFVFHCASHSRPDVEKSPIDDIVAANLDHYRLTTEYKHGMHFTALPTAFVVGFDPKAEMRIGSNTVWATETIGATAGFLEFKGDGLGTFERALDRCERLLAVLGSRLLESQKRVSESAEALKLRQAGESSIIGGIATSVTASMNDVLRWVYWWHSTEIAHEDVTAAQIRYDLNTDFESNTMTAGEIQALVSAWQNGAISRDTMLHNFRTGEILPPTRTNEQELELIKRDRPSVQMNSESRN